MSLLCTAIPPDVVTITPPFPERANATTFRSISSASRTFDGESSIPRVSAVDRTPANCPMPAADDASRSTKARVACGAICLSNSAHFPLMVYSKLEKPVILPPGCAMFWTKPAPTGSITFINTMGIVRVACCSDAIDTLPMLKMAAKAVDIAANVTGFDLQIAGYTAELVALAPDDPPQLLKSLLENSGPCFRFRIVRFEDVEYANDAYALGGLRLQRDRPSCRTAENTQKFPSPHGLPRAEGHAR